MQIKQGSVSLKVTEDHCHMHDIVIPSRNEITLVSALYSSFQSMNAILPCLWWYTVIALNLLAIF